MEIVVFEGEIKLGDSKDASMVFAQDFRVMECATGLRKLAISTTGVEILGPKEHHEISSHPVYLDHTLIGRLDGGQSELTLLPPIEAGVHRVEIHVSSFPGLGLCDDFVLKRVAFSCA